MISTFIKVRFSVIGFHNYPDAPEEVKYLRDRHRHQFNFSVEINVSGLNRELEFHTVKRRLLSLYGVTEVGFEDMSCEMIAVDLIKILISWYGKDRSYIVEVSEDGECSGVATYTER
jgi:hypothetical protein